MSDTKIDSDHFDSENDSDSTKISGSSIISEQSEKNVTEISETIVKDYYTIRELKEVENRNDLIDFIETVDHFKKFQSEFEMLKESLDSKNELKSDHGLFVQNLWTIFETYREHEFNLVEKVKNDNSTVTKLRGDISRTEKNEDNLSKLLPEKDEELGELTTKLDAVHFREQDLRRTLTIEETARRISTALEDQLNSIYVRMGIKDVSDKMKLTIKSDTIKKLHDFRDNIKSHISHITKVNQDLMDENKLLKQQISENDCSRLLINEYEEAKMNLKNHIEMYKGREVGPIVDQDVVKYKDYIKELMTTSNFFEVKLKEAIRLNHKLNKKLNIVHKKLSRKYKVGEVLLSYSELLKIRLMEGVGAEKSLQKIFEIVFKKVRRDPAISKLHNKTKNINFKSKCIKKELKEIQKNLKLVKKEVFSNQKQKDILEKRYKIKFMQYNQLKNETCRIVKADAEIQIEINNEYEQRQLLANSSKMVLETFAHIRKEFLEVLLEEYVNLVEKCNKLNIYSHTLKRSLIQSESFELTRDLDQQEYELRQIEIKHNDLKREIDQFNFLYQAYKKKLSAVEEKEHEIKLLMEIFKKEISSKMDEIVKTESKVNNLEQIKITSSMDLINMQKLSKETNRLILIMSRLQLKNRRSLENVKMEEQKINKQIENEIFKTKEMASLLEEKTSDLAEIGKKIDSLTIELKKSEIAYKKRLEDIRVLKLQICQIRLDTENLKKKLLNTADLKTELYHLHKDLLEEKLKIKSLEDSLQKPINVHHWRELEITDPSKYDLLIENLTQAKIARKAVVSKMKMETYLKELLKIYEDIKNRVMKHPGPTVVCEIEIIKKNTNSIETNIVNLTKEIKTLETEMEVAKFQKLMQKKNMDNIKKKYFNLKLKVDRKKQIIEDQMIKINQTKVTTEDRKLHFMGGGFNMTVYE